MPNLTKKEFEWDLVGEKKTYVIAQKISNLVNKSSKRHDFPLLEQAASTISELLGTTKLCVQPFHT